MNTVEYHPYTLAGKENNYQGNPSNVLHLKSTTRNTDFIPLDQGQDQMFALSADIKAGGTGTSTVGYLTVEWYDSVGIIRTDRNIGVKEWTDWQRYSTLLKAPFTAVNAKIILEAAGSTDVYFDNIQFEKSPQVRDYNVIENSSFERGIVKWTSSDGNSSIYTANPSDPLLNPRIYTGKNSLRINRSTTSGTSYVESQSVIPVRANTTYTFGGHIQSQNLQTSVAGGAWIHAYVYDQNGVYVNDYATKLVKKNTDWTKYVYVFNSPSDGFIKLRVEMKDAKVPTQEELWG